MATRNLLSRREAGKHWMASQSPFQLPSFRLVHAVLLLVAAAVGVLGMKSPGLLADLSSVHVGDYHALTLACTTVWILSVYALVAVRSYHPFIGVALLFEMLFFPLRVGVFQTVQEPLSLGILGLLVPMAILPIRVIIRLNDADKIRLLEAELKGGRDI